MRIFKDAVLSILATIAKQERIRLRSKSTPAWRRRGERAGSAGRQALVVDRARLARLDEQGMTTRENAEELRISAASVCRMLKGHLRPQDPATGV